MNLQGQTALVTGASSGIGAAIAEQLVTAGVKVILLARRIGRLEEWAKQMQVKTKTPIFIAEGDVRHPEAITQILHSLPKAFRDIDILVNSAGLAAGLEWVHEAHLEDWEAMIDTNFKGLVYVTRAVLPLMRERERGHIINGHL